MHAGRSDSVAIYLEACTERFSLVIEFWRWLFAEAADTTVRDVPPERGTALTLVKTAVFFSSNSEGLTVKSTCVAAALSSVLTVSPILMPLVGSPSSSRVWRKRDRLTTASLSEVPPLTRSTGVIFSSGLVVPRLTPPTERLRVSPSS